LVVAQRPEERTPDATTSPALDDPDRQLRYALIDESVAGIMRGEESQPRGTNRHLANFGDDPEVIRSLPTGDVVGELRVSEDVVAAKPTPPRIPIRRLHQHVLEKAGIGISRCPDAKGDVATRDR
jgi:hypothetical protein